MSASGKTDQKTARGLRLKAALRENLKRRKAQSRGRASQAADRETIPAAAEAERPLGLDPDFRRNRGRD